jgi:3-oxoacyl-[acyl-carrier-protein] synthase-1
MRLAITSLGMITSIGRCAPSTCASQRAGIVRPQPIEYYQLVDEDTQAPTPLIGHPIRGYTEGFAGVGLWIRLAVGCIKDLISYGGLPPAGDAAFWQGTGLVAVTPVLDPKRLDVLDGVEADFLVEAYLKRLLNFLELPLRPQHLHAISMGHAGTAAALKRADEIMAPGELDRVMILACDSYLDRSSLGWLGDHDRLKSDSNPVGLAPGEAGICLLIESESSCRRRNARIEAVILGAAVGLETNHLFSGEINQGVALTSAIAQALSESSLPSPFSGDILSDLNGEVWRANELGNALVRLRGALDADRSNLVAPATSFGDVGAASGAVAVGLAVRSFVRRYSASNHALILSSSESGQVGSVCLTGN